MIEIERPSGVDDAAWKKKMERLRQAAASGEAKVVHKPVRDGKAQKEAIKKGMIKPGDHADHGLDLQFGGKDEIGNIVSTPGRINTSVGAQGKQRLKHPNGTPISEFREVPPKPKKTGP